MLSAGGTVVAESPEDDELAVPLTYLLALQPARVEGGGTYHRLRITAPGAGRGAKVVHRPGYYETTPYAAAGSHGSS